MIAKTLNPPMNDSRFVVAKYVSDLRRMEPRNVGVVLWSNGRVASKFLPREDASFVNDLETYDRWRSFWEEKLNDDVLSVPRLAPVQKSDPAFLDAFMRTQDGNYLLFQGGDVLEHVATDKVGDATKFLFDEIVAVHAEKKPDDQSFDRIFQNRSKQVFERLGVWNRPDFHKGDDVCSVRCRIHNVWKVVPFHFALGDGDPRSVYQRVRLDIEQNWQLAVFRFEALLKSNKYKKQQCAALIQATSEEMADQNVKDSLAILKDVATVANLNNQRSACGTLSRVISL